MTKTRLPVDVVAGVVNSSLAVAQNGVVGLVDPAVAVEVARRVADQRELRSDLLGGERLVEEHQFVGSAVERVLLLRIVGIAAADFDAARIAVRGAVDIVVDIPALRVCVLRF